MLRGERLHLDTYRERHGLSATPPSAAADRAEPAEPADRPPATGEWDLDHYTYEREAFPIIEESSWVSSSVCATSLVADENGVIQEVTACVSVAVVTT